jgi:hypothetical protein
MTGFYSLLYGRETGIIFLHGQALPDRKFSLTNVSILHKLRGIPGGRSDAGNDLISNG